MKKYMKRSEVWTYGIGLFGIGLGNGPLFPNMLHLTPQHFSRELSHSYAWYQYCWILCDWMHCLPCFQKSQYRSTMDLIFQSGDLRRLYDLFDFFFGNQSVIPIRASRHSHSLCRMQYRIWGHCGVCAAAHHKMKRSGFVHP